jgi:ATP-dependent protease ClpP protease subunit
MKNAPWYSIQARANQTAEICIYGDIGESWSEETTSARAFVAELQKLSARSITVRINSFGGSVPDGLAIYNALKRNAAKVTTSIEGAAYSIASLIAMAGDQVEMAENALLMIHAPWTIGQGNAPQLRETADLLEKHAAAMATSYVRPGGLTHDQAMQLLTDGADHWYSATEAKQAGLVDTITQPLQIAASFSTDRFPHRPPAAAAATSEGKPTMTTEVTPVQAAASTPPPVVAAAPNLAPDLQISTDEIRAEALRDDQLRRRNIEAIAGPWINGADARTDVRALVKQAQDNGQGIEAFRAQFLQLLGRNSQSLGSGLIMTVEDEGDKFRAGVTAGLMIRSGLVTNDTTNEFRGYSLIELARACLHRRNISTKGLDKMGVVASAFTHGTSDFTNLLADVANKAMLKGWDDAEETFPVWTSRGTLPDFKTGNRVDLNTFPALGKVEPGAEYKYVTTGDRKEQISLATYGALFSISRQAIINDDLDSFSRIPSKLGRSAIRTVGNLVYAVLTGNPNMADGTALFHANHANLLTGAAISTASVDLMAAGMARQTDATGTTLNINLGFLIVPRTLKGLAMTVMVSENEITSAKTATIPNWMRNTFEVVADPRLDASSTSNWFGAANPAINDTIEVCYLDGNDAPQLEQQGGWTVDGVEYKVRIDAGVKALDWRGLAKNPN